MAGSVIDFNLTGDSSDVVNAYNKIIKKQKAAIDQLKKQGRASKKSGEDVKRANKGIGNSITGAAAKYASFAAAVGVAGAAVAGLISKHKQLRAEVDLITISFDVEFTKFAVQAGLTRKELIEFQERFFELSKKFGIKPQIAAQASREFISQGGALAGVRGLPIERIIETAKTTSVTEGITDLTKAMVGTLRNLGQELNAENLKRLRDQITGLFARSVFQAADLAVLGRNIALLKKVGIQQETQFALFDISKSIAGDPSTGATAVKAAILNLATASTKPRLVQQLAAGGLKPEDIDLVGENIQTVLERLSKFSKQLEPERVLPFFKELAGKLFAGTLIGLIERRAEIPIRIASQRDPEATEIRLRTATTGPAVERTRLETTGQRFKFNRINQQASDKALEGFLDKLQGENRIGTVRRFIFEDIIFRINKIAQADDAATAAESTIINLGTRKLLEEFRKFRLEAKQSSAEFKTVMKDLIQTNQGQEKAQIDTVKQAEKATDLKEVNVSEKTD